LSVFPPTASTGHNIYTLWQHLGKVYGRSWLVKVKLGS
jgi:hypothetical protein